MSPVVVNSIIVAALSGLVSGIAVALLNYLLNKKKSDAEIRNLTAQTAKASAETAKILEEVKSLSATVSYSLAGSRQEVLIDGSTGLDGFHVKGSGGQFWDHAKPISPKGQGELKFEDGVLNIQRTNTDGRFELLFQRYRYKGSERDFIPRDDLISGKRRLLATFEAKTVGAAHSLRLVIRDPKAGGKLAETVVSVSSNQWTTYNAFLQPDPSVDSHFRIDDEQVSFAPSSVQIRNLVLVQKN